MANHAKRGRAPQRRKPPVPDTPATYDEEELTALMQPALEEHNRLVSHEQAIRDQLEAVHDQRLAAQGKVQMLSDLISMIGMKISAPTVIDVPETEEPENNGQPTNTEDAAVKHD